MNCKETKKQNDLVFRCKECIFEDEDKTFYVAKYAKKYGIYSYSNIFTYDNSGRLYKRV